MILLVLSFALVLPEAQAKTWKVSIPGGDANPDILLYFINPPNLKYE